LLKNKSQGKQNKRLLKA